jgi:hypothetical protein
VAAGENLLQDGDEEVEVVPAVTQKAYAKSVASCVRKCFT